MKSILPVIALALGLTAPAIAQEFPTGPVTIVVPYTPSGNTDTFARFLTPFLEEKWGQPVIVDNRPGGGSMVGTAYVAHAKPDGNTILMTTSAFVTAPAIQKELPFDSRTDLIPVNNVGYVSFILVTNGDAEHVDFDDIVAESKKNPIFAATAGLGATNHFAIEKIIAETGAGFEPVHYKGGAQAALAILGGEAQLYTSSVTSAGKHMESGKMKGVAVLADERIAEYPDVPTIVELGYPGLKTSLWVGMFAPAGTDPAIIAQMNADVNEVLQNPEFLEKVEPLDWTLTPGSPEDFSKKVDVELTQWAKIAADAGISK